ncbi:MAG: hypothetical protein KVP17_002982, partial [Porospora cf. gigantea B]
HEAVSSVTQGSSFKDVVSRRSGVSTPVGVESAAVISDLSSESSEASEELVSAPTTVVATGPSFTYTGGTQVVKKPVVQTPVETQRVEDVPDHEAVSSVTQGSSFKDVVSRGSDISGSAAVISDLSSESSEASEEPVSVSAPTTVVATGPSFTYTGGTQVVKKPVVQTPVETQRVEDVPDHEAVSSVTQGSSFKDVVSRSSGDSTPVSVESAAMISDLSSESSEPSEELVSPPTTVVATGPSFTYTGGTQVVEKPVVQTAVETQLHESVSFVSSQPSFKDIVSSGSGVSTPVGVESAAEISDLTSESSESLRAPVEFAYTEASRDVPTDVESHDVAEKEYSFTYTGAYGDLFQAVRSSDNLAEIGSEMPKGTRPKGSKPASSTSPERVTSQERATKAPSVVVASGPSFSYSGEHSLTIRDTKSLSSSETQHIASASPPTVSSPPSVSSPTAVSNSTSGAPSYRDVLLMKSTRETSRPPQPRPATKSPSGTVRKSAGNKAAVMSSESSDSTQEHVVKAASVVVAAGPSFTYSGTSRVVQKTRTARTSTPPLIEDVTEKSDEDGAGLSVPTVANTTIPAPAETGDSSDEEESSESSCSDEIDIKPPSVVVATGPSFTYNGGSQVIKKAATQTLAKAHRVEDVTETLEDVYGRSPVPLPITTELAVVTDMDSVDESSVLSDSSDEIDIKPLRVVVASGPSFTYNGGSQVIKKPATQNLTKARRVEDVVETLQKDGVTAHVVDDGSDSHSESSAGVIWAAPALTDRSKRPTLDKSTSGGNSITDLSTTVERTTEVSHHQSVVAAYDLEHLVGERTEIELDMESTGRSMVSCDNGEALQSSDRFRDCDDDGMSVTESSMTPVSTNVLRCAANVAGFTEPAAAPTEETVDISEMASSEVDVPCNLGPLALAVQLVRPAVESLVPVHHIETATPHVAPSVGEKASEAGVCAVDILSPTDGLKLDDLPAFATDTAVESLTVASVTAEPFDAPLQSESTVGDTVSLTEPVVEALSPMAPIETATPTLEIEVTTPSVSQSIPVDGSVNLLSAFLAFSSVQTVSTPYETAVKPVEANHETAVMPAEADHETAVKPLEADLSTLDIPHGSQILSLSGGLKLVVLPGRYLVVDLDGT